MSADLMDYNSSSDYSSASSSLDWGQELNTMLQELKLQDAAVEKPKQKSNSFNDLRTSRKMDDVMQEFRMIGSDSPYDPQDDDFWEFKLTAPTPTPPQSNQYHRQKSWPGAEKTRYGDVRGLSSASSVVSASGLGHTRQKRLVPEDRADGLAEWNPLAYNEGLLPRLRASKLISPEQLAVVQSLPDEVLHALLKDLIEHRGYSEQPLKKKVIESGGGGGGGGSGECRFCKNNGERASFVRSHALKDARGRVECPVLRAFVCRRCGAHGDNAHTIKYCPLSTDHERHMSTALMRSVRLASGRKRIVYPAPPSVNSVNEDVPTYQPIDYDQPLDPVWAALEKKLMW